MTEPQTFVADTNVLISRLIFRKSVAAQAFDVALTKYELLASNDVHDELSQVIARSKFDRYATRAERSIYLSDFRKASRFVKDVPPVAVCRDPKDDKFRALALAGGASVILTGDQDLLTLHPFREVAILSPRQFLDR